MPLANLIVKETLSEEDVLTCQKTIYNLVDMERKNDPLPISTVGSRGKGPKRCFILFPSPTFQLERAHSVRCICLTCLDSRRDEQYRTMWNELETLVKTHAADTDRHQRVLDCIVACRSKPAEDEDRKKRGRKREDREDRTDKSGGKDAEDKSWQDSERLGFVLRQN